MAVIETQKEWEEKQCNKILEFVRNEIYLELRFLQPALLALVPTASEELYAFATDGMHLYYETGQVIRVFTKNAPYLDRAFLHTVCHCIFSHLWIKGSRDAVLWGLACDISVEYTIDAMGKDCTRRALSWLRKQFYEQIQENGKGASAAVIYRRLLEDKNEEEIHALRTEFYTDDHRYWPKEEKQNAGQSAARKRWNKIVRQTTLEQKRRGTENKEGEELLMAQLTAEKSRRSYREFLQKFTVCREELHCDPDEFDLNYYTYGLRIYKNMPLIEPVESREVEKIKEIVIVLDTSYSTSGELIKNFLRETLQILSTKESFFARSRIRILQCDEKVRAEEVIVSREKFEALIEKFTVVGGGGTDFRPAFSYVEQLIAAGEIKELGGLLYFTDGKGIYPKKKPAYQTAFLFLNDFEDTSVPAWAMRLRLEPQEFAGK